MIVVAQATHFIIDDLGERLYLVRHRQELVDLLLILDHREGDFGMAEHEGHFLGNTVRIDRHRNGPECLGGHHRPIEPWTVRTDDGDLVSSLQAQRFQTDGECADFFTHLGPGPALPDPEILFPERRPVSEDLRVAHENLRKGVLPARCSAGRPYHRCFFPLEGAPVFQGRFLWGYETPCRPNLQPVNC